MSEENQNAIDVARLQERTTGIEIRVTHIETILDRRLDELQRGQMEIREAIASRTCRAPSLCIQLEKQISEGSGHIQSHAKRIRSLEEVETMRTGQRKLMIFVVGIISTLISTIIGLIFKHKP